MSLCGKQTTSQTFITSGNDTNPQEVGQLTGEVSGAIAAAAAQGSCRAAIDLAMMSTVPIPGSPPFVSYCQWLGVICCISGESDMGNSRHIPSASAFTSFNGT